MTCSEIEENEIDNGLFPGYDFVDTAELGVQDDSRGLSTFALPLSPDDGLMQWTSNLSGGEGNNSSGNSSSVQEELNWLRTEVARLADESSALRTLNVQQNATIQRVVQELFQIRNILHAHGVVVTTADVDPTANDAFDLQFDDFVNLSS